ncbi:ROK family transcriptional regulator [Actinospica robiniae]|uniref:ROK family transcriptional regulator n=1 Tax=Actinospica robiniae TaxID=304901 RepID=UPI0005590A53|nr:ROK family transcriptional regulator [Actinospica robiniae]
MQDRRRATVKDVRRENRSAVLWRLYFHRPCSRQDLAEATGLSQASMTSVVRELLTEGVVTEAGSQDSDGGRPRTLLEIDPDYGFVVGVDVGETRIQVGLYDLTLAERAQTECRLADPTEHEPETVAQTIATGLEAVLRDAAVDAGSVLGVGVGVPGIVEQGDEALVHGQTYGWDAVPLERLLRAHTDLPLRFENCAKTTGQAELWFGAGRGARSAVVAILGSGVGASLITGGGIYRGATSSAGEWGHTKIVANGRRCRCGSTGCLEAYVGAEAILDRAGIALPADGDEESALAALAADPSPVAAEVMAETAEYLGVGIANLVNLFNPERVVLCGWAGRLLGVRLLPAIRASAGRHALRHPFAATSIELGLLDSDRSALGAATLPLESVLDSRIRRAAPCR